MKKITKDVLSQTANSPMEKAAQLVELERVKKEISEIIISYKADLLAVTKELDVVSLKTGSYTITRAQRITPIVNNFKKLRASLEKADIPYETEEVFTEQMNATFKQAIKEGKELAGLEAKETEYIIVRVIEK